MIHGLANLVEITVKDAYAGIVGMGIGTIVSIAGLARDAFINLSQGGYAGQVHDQNLNDRMWIDHYMHPVSGYAPNGIMGAYPFYILNRNPRVPNPYNP